MKIIFYSGKFNELSRYIYFCWGIINSSEAMRKNSTRGSKVRCILNEDFSQHICIWFISYILKYTYFQYILPYCRAVFVDLCF